MPLSRCPSCQLPLTEAEGRLSHCPTCDHPFEVAVSAVSVVPPGSATTAKEPRPRPIGGTIAVLIVGFLGLAALLWYTRATPSPLITAEREQYEQRLAKLEQQPTPANIDVEALQARLLRLETHVQELKKANDLTNLQAKVDALAQKSLLPPAPPGPLEIRVISKNWGDADPENLQAVCVSAANELWLHFPHRRMEPITVNSTNKDPMVIFGRGPEGERRVLLNVEGRLWARCAYQFAHEFCHILCNYRATKNPHHWFEEALCETASLFALRKMAQTWKTKPPYPNWKSYATALDDYANTMPREVPAMDNLSLAEWFAKNEPTLRRESTNRPRNRVVALAILPLLEKNPQHWQAIGYLNQWEPKDDFPFQAYLSDWYRRVPAEHQPFVQEVATLLAVELNKPGP